MFSSAQSSVIYSQQLTKSDVLKFGPVSEQGAETTFHKEAAIFFRPNVSLMLIDQFYQQIFASRKLKTFSVVTNQGKFEKKLDFSSNEAGKLIRAICCTKRDPLARAPPGRKNVAGLAAERARSRAHYVQHVAAAKRAPKREHVCTTDRYGVKDHSAQ